MLPPRELGPLPAPCTPPHLSGSRTEFTASEAQHSERLAPRAEEPSQQQPPQQPASLPAPSQLAVPESSDGEELQFSARQWQQPEDLADRTAVALQYLSPLGPDAALVPPRSSFEAKWGRWCVSHTRSCVCQPHVL